ncbi:MAG: 4Fe-4S ferredoxin, partial [Aliarcobacter sp.]|nr:4Fe-4S ferredoxin [Aliarcobacter sp.]
MQEFIYYNPAGLDFPVSEKILVTSNIEDIKSKEFLISNSPEVKSELTALEIDFYIRNSQDNPSKKIKNVLELYEIAATKYDFAQDIPFSQEVTNDVLLISSNEEDSQNFISKVKEEGIELFSINEEIIKSITGHIGNLQVIVSDEEEGEITLNVSQIVWFDAKEAGLERSGTLDPNLTSIEEVIETLKKNINSYSYKKFTTYNQNICQYHGRREEI